MTERELEQRLADALARTAPDDLDAILSRCGAQNGSVMEMKALKPDQNIIDVEVTELKPGKKWNRWLAAACAALVLLGAGGGAALAYQNSYAVASVVSLDVNPSIELRVNRGERVISCTALNEEAAAVLFSMNGGADLKGTKLDVAVNAIVGALVQAGYLDSISSAILISVEDNNQDRAARLQAELVASVDGVLRTQAPNTSVLSQVLTMDAGTSAVYGSGISMGKSALVQKVLERNGAGDKAFDQLAALSVEELNDLLETGETRIPIGKAAAAMAVETYAGTAELSSTTTDVDPELDEFPPHYEVELKTSWGEFDYRVDAFTGEVLSGPKDIFPASADPVPQAPDVQTPNTQTPSTQTPSTQTPNTQTPPSAQTQDIGLAAAKKAALSHAGLSESQVTGMKAERDWDNGRLEYEVEFWYGAVEYDYTILAADGSILKQERDDHAGSGSGTSYIGEAEAKAAALSHASCLESAAVYCNVWMDYDDGRPECYKVEFCANGTEYEYEIGLYDGSILKHESESCSSHHSGQGSHHTETSSADIGQAAAKQAALNHAGLSESQTTKMKVERDWDDGRLEYDVEFKSGGVEYEYTIDGTTGAVLEYERDIDD